MYSGIFSRSRYALTRCVLGDTKKKKTKLTFVNTPLHVSTLEIRLLSNMFIFCTYFELIRAHDYSSGIFI